jgi:hypothetical protein
MRMGFAHRVAAGGEPFTQLALGGQGIAHTKHFTVDHRPDFKHQPIHRRARFRRGLQGSIHCQFDVSNEGTNSQAVPVL